VDDTNKTISKKTYIESIVIPEGSIGNPVLIETISPIETFGDDRRVVLLMTVIVTAILLCLPAYALSQPSLPEGRGEGTRVKVWEKDPFVPPSVQAAPEVTGREVAPDLGLSTILFSDGHSSAVINGKIYHIGDDISGHKILDIKRSYVILGGGKKTYKLELRK